VLLDTINDQSDTLFKKFYSNMVSMSGSNQC